jgi:hypothetical protein
VFLVLGLRFKVSRTLFHNSYIFIAYVF